MSYGALVRTLDAGRRRSARLAYNDGDLRIGAGRENNQAVI
jgi:hypothetical protein